MTQSDFAKRIQYLIDRSDDKQLSNYLFNELSVPEILQIANTVIEKSIEDDRNNQAHNTTYHPSGFVKIYLFNSDQGFRVRLHIWKNAVNTETLVHRHSSKLVSKIISGSLLNTTFKLTENQKPIYRKAIYKAMNNECSITELLEFTEPEIVDQRFVKQNDVYEIDADAYHTSKQLTEELITLVLQYPDECDYGVVLADETKLNHSAIHMGKPGKKELLDLQSSLRAILED